jgi:hypothetical protein
MPVYGFPMDTVVSLHQLVSNAIVLDGQTDEAEEMNSGEEP